MADGSKVSTWIACLAALLMIEDDTAGGEVDDLYQGRTVVTGQGEESRRQGFAGSASSRSW